MFRVEGYVPEWQSGLLDPDWGWFRRKAILAWPSLNWGDPVAKTPPDNWGSHDSEDKYIWPVHRYADAIPPSVLGPYGWGKEYTNWSGGATDNAFGHVYGDYTSKGMGTENPGGTYSRDCTWGFSWRYNGYGSKNGVIFQTRTAGQVFTMGTDGSGNLWFWYNGATRIIITNATWATYRVSGGWDRYLIVNDYESNKLYIYINGVLAASSIAASWAHPLWAYHIYVMTDGGNGQRQYAGRGYLSNFFAASDTFTTEEIALWTWDPQGWERPAGMRPNVTQVGIFGCLDADVRTRLAVDGDVRSRLAVDGDVRSRLAVEADQRSRLAVDGDARSRLAIDGDVSTCRKGGG